jgi:hypothetical protein
MRKSILVLAGAIVIAAGGVSYAISGNQTYTACVDAAGGPLIYSSTGSCGAGQTTLSWNQQGPPGVQGIQGVQGLEGPSGQTGAPGSAASATNAVVGVVTAKYRRGFATQITVSGTGTHLVTGHVHIEVDPSQWKLDGHIDCALLAGIPNGAGTTLDSSTTPVVHGSGPMKFDIDLDGFVTIEPPASSQNSQSTASTDRLAVFRCGTTMRKTSVKFAPIFSFVRMTDELLKTSIVQLPPKVAVKLKIGP